MSWDKVGQFLSENVQNGVGLIGSLLTGNVPGAVSAGIAMVSQATGTVDPDMALEQLVNSPDSMLALKRIQLEKRIEINRHIEVMTKAELEDKQKEHTTTQATIQNSDNSEGLIKWNRPLQAWFMLFVASLYLFKADVVQWEILTVILTIPFSYNGLRSIDKIGKFKNPFSRKA